MPSFVDSDIGPGQPRYSSDSSLETLHPGQLSSRQPSQDETQNGAQNNGNRVQQGQSDANLGDGSSMDPLSGRQRNETFNPHFIPPHDTADMSSVSVVSINVPPAGDAADGDDYASKPPPVPLPSSPSYSYYLQALEATSGSLPIDLIDPLEGNNGNHTNQSITNTGHNEGTRRVSLDSQLSNEGENNRGSVSAITVGDLLETQRHSFSSGNSGHRSRINNAVGLTDNHNNNHNSSNNINSNIRRNVSDGAFALTRTYFDDQRLDNVDANSDSISDGNKDNHAPGKTRSNAVQLRGSSTSLRNFGSSTSLRNLGGLTNSADHGIGISSSISFRANRRSSSTRNHHRRASSSNSVASMDEANSIPSSSLPSSLSASSSSSSAKKGNNSMKALKAMVFTFLNPRQHLALAICRDMPLWSCLYYMFQCFYEAYQVQYGHEARTATHHRLLNGTAETLKTRQYNEIMLANLLNTRSSEYLMTGMWCFVSAFMVYSILDGLIVRWIVVYSVPAAIVRMLSMSVLLITIIRVVLLICNPNDSYLLHTWIFISCILTITYIVQNFFVHDLDDKIKTRAPLEDGDENVEDNEDESGNDNENGNEDAEDGGGDTSNRSIESEIIHSKSRSIISNILNGRIRLTGRKFSRYFNYYNIVIYAVMPIGVASFVTMIVLLRNILILKLDIETVYRN